MSLREIVNRIPVQFCIERLRFGLRVTSFEIELHISGTSSAVFNPLHERCRNTAAPQIRSHPEPLHLSNMQHRVRDRPNPNTTGGMGVGTSQEEYAQRRLEFFKV